jgi:hypothetical protein
MRVRFVSTRFIAVVAMAALGLASASMTGQLASAAASTRSSVVKVPVFTLPLTMVG